MEFGLHAFQVIICPHVLASDISLEAIFTCVSLYKIKDCSILGTHLFIFIEEKKQLTMISLSLLHIQER